jgi:pimeloyl-ACP methyl ester carboxylesterase
MSLKAPNLHATPNRFVYIHGFASSPDSRKAQAFQSAFAALGVSLEIPSMDEGDFEHLTIPGQLNVLERTLDRHPARLVGSSMGGYLAALYAGRRPEVSRLVLLAPAFNFALRWNERNPSPKPADIEEFHYGARTSRKVHYRLIEEALNFPPFPDFTQPALIFHGAHDEIVPIEYSRAFAETHANARLIELDSDHELLNVLDQIIQSALPFLAA